MDRDRAEVDGLDGVSPLSSSCSIPSRIGGVDASLLMIKEEFDAPDEGAAGGGRISLNTLRGPASGEEIGPLLLPIGDGDAV